MCRKQKPTAHNTSLKDNYSLIIYHNITPKLFGEPPPTNRPPYIYNSI